jgi:uncharacterized protein (TIGR04255 family)
MGKKMNRAPIYYALAQVRFSAVLALDQYLPAIQEKMRKVGFPDFEKTMIATLNFALNPTAPGAAMPAIQQSARNHFLNDKRTSGFLLDQDSLTYVTTDYDTFEPLLSTFSQGLRMVHSATELSYSERVGLRYLNVVCPRSGEQVSHYLAPSVLGLFDKLSPWETVHSFSETRTRHGKAHMVSRSIIQNQLVEGPPAFPQDLSPIPVQFGRPIKVSGEYAMLDIDSWQEDREKFDLVGLEKVCTSLHDELRRSFELMVTPHAIEVWK